MVVRRDPSKGQDRSHRHRDPSRDQDRSHSTPYHSKDRNAIHNVTRNTIRSAGGAGRACSRNSNMDTVQLWWRINRCFSLFLPFIIFCINYFELQTICTSYFVTVLHLQSYKMYNITNVQFVKSQKFELYRIIYYEYSEAYLLNIRILFTHFINHYHFHCCPCCRWVQQILYHLCCQWIQWVLVLPWVRGCP